MSKVKIYSRFNVPESAAVEFGESCTQQHFKDECDINNIVRSYKVKEPPPPCFFDDCTVTDLQQAYALSDDISERFMMLPSDVRARFNHNPLELLNFVGNSDNVTVARELGLLKPEPKKEASIPVPADLGKAISLDSATKKDVSSTAGVQDNATHQLLT